MLRRRQNRAGQRLGTRSCGNRAGRLSIQVLLEPDATLTRKLKPAFGPSEARKIVLELTAWRPIPVDLHVMQRAWSLENTCSLSWWDALIVAAAQASRCSVLLAEDLQHGQVFGAVRVVNPFLEQDRTPAQILQALEPRRLDQDPGEWAFPSRRRHRYAEKGRCRQSPGSALSLVLRLDQRHGRS